MSGFPDVLNRGKLFRMFPDISSDGAYSPIERIRRTMFYKTKYFTIPGSLWKFGEVIVLITSFQELCILGNIFFKTLGSISCSEKCPVYGQHHSYMRTHFSVRL